MKKSHTPKLAYAALFAALIFIGTLFLKLPLAFGYLNLGDPFVLLAGYLLGGSYAALASAVGAVLADILSGYAIYVPATILLKPLMAWIVFALCRLGSAQKSHLRFVLGAILAEAVMVLGYFLFDTVLYGLSGAVAALGGNVLQGIASAISATIAAALLKKAKLTELFFE